MTKPRRPRIEIDADNLHKTLDRWKSRLTDEEYDGGLQLLQALQEIHREFQTKQQMNQ